MKDDHPILDALKWAAIGAIAAMILFLAYSAVSPKAEQNDAALDREAQRGHR